MSDHLLKTIGDLETEIQSREEQIVGLKRSVNVLCGMAGIPAKYEDAGQATATARRGLNIAGDQFVNVALNTAVKDYLTMRKTAGLEGPASAEEIYGALEQGGFDFSTKDKATALGGLRISMGKSSHTFKKLNNGNYGLNEWYGIQPRKPTAKKTDTAAPASDPSSPAEEPILDDLV